MSRFVLLFHDWPSGPRGSHCDLMLEAGESLRTWALVELPHDWAAVISNDKWESQPQFAGGNLVVADRLADHRIAYLDYEGQVSGDRGHVRRIDRGEFRLLHDSSDAIEVELIGEVLRGAVELRSDGENWQLALR